MPGFDRTGPLGNGPRTGRGYGPCGRASGWGRGFGRGGVFGLGRRIFGRFRPLTDADRRAELADYKKFLREELSAVEEEERAPSNGK